MEDIKVRYKLKQHYENACNAYLKAFCDKHGFDYEPDCWVANDTGTIACIADYFVSMETIITDINTDAPEEEFLKWYDYCLELSSLGVSGLPNFKSWLAGCPRKSDAEFEKIRQAKKEVEEAKRRLMECLELEESF